MGTADYEALLAHSEAHLYLTVPFVLSWSLLEAMAIGLVASDTGPVREVLTHGEDALLAPFDAIGEITEALQVCLTDREATRNRVLRAQERSLLYDSSRGVRGWARLLEDAGDSQESVITRLTWELPRVRKGSVEWKIPSTSSTPTLSGSVVKPNH